MRIQNFCASIVSTFTIPAAQTINLYNTHTPSDHALDEGSYWIEGSLGNYFTDQKQITVEDASKSGDDDLVMDVSIPSADFFAVFPNPTEGSFTVAFDQRAVDEPVLVEIYGVTGSRIKHREMDQGAEAVFSLEGHQPGVYLIRVMQGENMGVERIIKR